MPERELGTEENVLTIWFGYLASLHRDNLDNFLSLVTYFFTLVTLLKVLKCLHFTLLFLNWIILDFIVCKKLCLIFAN